MTNAAATATATETHALYEHFPLPWRFLGYTEMVYQACQGAPIQAAGSCDICGTCIRHAYRFQDSTGRAFVTGCDCAQKVSPGYYAECSAARKAARAEALREARSEAAKARRTLNALRRAFQIRECMTVWEPELEMARELADNASGFPAKIGADVADCIGRGADPSENSVAMIVRMYREHMTPVGGHFGTVGKRSESTLTLLREHEFESAYGTKWIFTFAAPNGERIVWFTTSYPRVGGGDSTESRRVRVGDTVTARFTVAEHGSYEGTPQTTVKRLQVRS